MHWQDFEKKCIDFITYLRVEKNLSPHTQQAYQSDLRQFIQFWQTLPNDQIQELTCRQIIERYLVSLFYKKIDKSSIARKFSCLTSLEKFLKKEGVALNLKLKRPRLDKKLPIYLSIDEIFHLLDNVANEQLKTPFPLRDKAILELMYATGIRCSELIAIKINDIDLDEKTIRIMGKGNKERIVLFGSKAHERLIAYLNTERSSIASDHQHLFLNHRGSGLTSRSIQRIVVMFRAFLHVKRNITPHKIRHSFATHLLSKGVDLRIIQELLGHQAITSTERYTHVSLEQLNTLCNQIHPIRKILRGDTER